MKIVQAKKTHMLEVTLSEAGPLIRVTGIIKGLPITRGDEIYLALYTRWDGYHAELLLEGQIEESIPLGRINLPDILVYTAEQKDKIQEDLSVAAKAIWIGKSLQVVNVQATKRMPTVSLEYDNWPSQQFVIEIPEYLEPLLPVPA